jgi:hypothetical protein
MSTAPFAGAPYKAPVVRYTAEVDRILKLPRRQQGITPEQVVEMTEALRKDTGSMKLRPVQALALLEAMIVGGLFGPIGVGEGKTLITLLLAYVLEAQSYLLVLPANLIEKTKRDYAKYAQHFHLPPLGSITMLSYELLGRVQAETILDRIKPDVIAADEVHKFKNRKAACTKRMLRYMDANPSTKFIGLSGTVMQKSIRDFSHIIRWCLKDGAPVPRTVAETEDFAYALDERIPEDCRFAPGALMKFCTAEDLAADDEVTAARRGFRRRLIETPGVVSTVGKGEEVNASIYVSAIRPTYKPVTDHHFQVLRKDMKRPDGEVLMTGAEVWGYARQLALGFHYVQVEKRALAAWLAKMKPKCSPYTVTMRPEYRAEFDAFLETAKPPKPWKDARRDWHSFAREFLSRSRTIDSELAVANAIDVGQVDDGGVLARWRAIKDTFQSERMSVWHDDSVLQVCADWMAKNEDGIVWCAHEFFGGALAEMTGRPYFGAEGLSASGQFIDDASGPIIASIQANKEGRNLQEKWSRNLVTAFPDNSDLAEQMIGRTHRPKQLADEVTIEIILGCYEHANAFRKARSGAQTVNDTVGAAQKLLIADLADWPDESEILSWKGWRWQKQVDICEKP